MLIENPNWLIFYTGLGLIILELIVGVDTGFDFLLIGLSLILGALTGFLFNNYLVVIVMAILACFLYIFFGRRIVKDKLFVSTHKTNIDALIGKEGMVLKPIEKNKAGQVKIENEVWRAVADKPIKKDVKIKIISVEGVTLKVV